MSQVVVVGGGLVGLATAYALVQRGVRVTVIEKEDGVARRQSGHTSGIVHSGVFLRSGSLQLQLTQDGAAALAQFCAERDIALRRTGQLVVATRERDVARLEGLARQARRKDVQVELLGREQVREREPHVDALAGLWVPDAGVCDYAAVARALAEEVTARGGQLHTATTALRVYDRAGRAHVLAHSDRTYGIVADQVVVCAGAQADRLHPSPATGPQTRTMGLRTEYARLRPEAEGLVRGLVFALPEEGRGLLGTHVVHTVDAGVLVGPTQVPALSVDGERRRDVSLHDVRTAATFPGTWRAARRHARYGLAQLGRSVSRPAMVRAARELVPALRTADLQPGPVGVEARAVQADGSLTDDFVIRRRGTALHVLHAPTPAATACLAIGEHLAQLL